PQLFRSGLRRRHTCCPTPPPHLLQKWFDAWEPPEARMKAPTLEPQPHARPRSSEMCRRAHGEGPILLEVPGVASHESGRVDQIEQRSGGTERDLATVEDEGPVRAGDHHPQRARSLAPII